MNILRAWRGHRAHLYALAAYAAVAVAFSWPLAAHLSTHLTGPVDTDAGIYVWNQWVFHRELVGQRSDPYFTDAIFSFTGPANLGLHNYTVLANLIALPLIKTVGVVAAFNITYLLLTVLTAYGMFLLGRKIAPDAPLESWIAGVLFAWSPMLVTRSSQHFSLLAAAPLPLFVILLLRIQQRARPIDAVLLGACVALAMSGDVYYAVYCVMLAVAFAVLHVVHINTTPVHADRQRWEFRYLDVVIVCLVALIAAIAITNGWEFSLFGRAIRMRTLYTPVLVITALVLVRLLQSYRLHIQKLDVQLALRGVRLAMIAAAVASTLLSPVLYAVGVRIADGRFDQPKIYWRSSPAGVDVLAFFVPNPNHPLAPRTWFTWLEQPMMAFEHVATIPLVVIAVIAGAIRLGWRPPHVWTALAAVFAVLAMGPFIHVAGVNTYIPGPWAILRYVPVVGLARTPSRMAVMVMMFVSVLFVLALRRLRHKYGRAAIAAMSVLLLAELLPAPRPLYSAAVPAIYHTIAADPRTDIRVLELPLGVSTGTFAVGAYSARAQFGQTVHGKAIAGGTLSRVSSTRIAEMRNQPIVNALLRMSEGETLQSHELVSLGKDVPRFLDRARLGYVVIDRTRASTELVTAVTRLLQLTYIEADGPHELYRPPLIPAVDNTPRR